MVAIGNIKGNLAGSWIVLVVAGALWGIGYSAQKANELRGMQGARITCKHPWCRLLGVGQGKDALYVRPAFLHIVGLLCLAAGLVEVWLSDTFHTLAIASGIALGGLLLWAFADLWSIFRRWLADR